MRLLCIGDIHGCNKTLIELLERVNPTVEDQMVFLGDYIDRGKRCFETIETLIALKEKFPKTVFLKGNHEAMMLKYFSPDATFQDMQLFLYNGGRITLDSYEEFTELEPREFDDLPTKHQIFFDELKVSHQIGDFFFTHAGINPNFPVNDQMDHELMWIRDSFLFHRTCEWGKETIIHGHTPMMEDGEMDHYHRAYKQRRNLDSGCVFGGDLTCEDVLTGERMTCRNIDNIDF